ncbi:MAG: hypothetical protein H7144_10825 [Burkholderiales bacterium]|nr:hypothetical protein [Phycisphaerae bacterium]
MNEISQIERPQPSVLRIGQRTSGFGTATRIIAGGKNLMSLSLARQARPLSASGSAIRNTDARTGGRTITAFGVARNSARTTLSEGSIVTTRTGVRRGAMNVAANRTPGSFANSAFSIGTPSSVAASRVDGSSSTSRQLQTSRFVSTQAGSANVSDRTKLGLADATPDRSGRSLSMSEARALLTGDVVIRSRAA